MIFVTGDTHGVWDIKKIDLFAEKNPHLTKNDYLIVCGDFGLLWNWTKTGEGEDGRWTSEELRLAVKYNKYPFTTLFVDGNHENFDRINSYPVTEWNGGKVHKITSSVIHLMRGQVYELCGKKLFTFGGAVSHDRGPARGRELEDEGVIWWPEEICSEEERTEARENLRKHNNCVDIIITHCLSDKTAMRLGYSDCSETAQFLSEVEDTIDFDTWYCGHYHEDLWVNTKTLCLYEDIAEVL